ncbi:MBL fold metallo-hydrolase [Microbacterium sp. Root180]|uniref:MBL fold metallo-hydrolase n=1 Tax=Microbacterium sp. Root180 TaxID=1736483 RepID=UPI0007000268|nr:MBL fold metallo-hydrolase [Microbacterium sp. Root180]KRB36843.1 MBL fold metallo-hydrolase [Microbacterium sp. Root180]
MLQQIAAGVWVHESDFLKSNTVIVQGRDGVLLIDPGITTVELDDIAADLRHLGQRVVAGFSTHPHWDHVLWHPDFGDVPRYGTAVGAATMAAFLSQPGWADDIAEGLPPEHADEIPMELLGLISGLPPEANEIPWDGPRVSVLEHRGHSEGHAALLIEDSRVLVVGDMLSDILMPFLDLQAHHPIEDYLSALQLFESVADRADAVIPGHGSVGDAAELHARIDLDLAYVRALRDGDEPDDPRVGPGAPLDWLPDIHRWQMQRLRELRGEPE